MSARQPATQTLYLGIDVGTTSTKAMVIDGAGVQYGAGSARYALESPAPGQYVQDADDWVVGVCDAVCAACAGVEPSHVASLAISAQGGTLVPVDDRRRPLAPARSWLDRRASASAETFERLFGADDFYRRTGWPIAPNNTAAQLLDLAHTDPQSFRDAYRFCDTAGYLNAWLTGEATTDTNVAGITQLINIGSETWDADILSAIGVQPERLPKLAPPGAPIGELTACAARRLGLPPGTPVGAGAQDQYCAALGVGAIADGDFLLSTGTAGVMLAVAGAPYPDPAGGIGSGRHFGPGLWGHFGEVSNGGVSLEWVRRLLGHGSGSVDFGDFDAILETTSAGAGGLSFFPYFDGTSPYDSAGQSEGTLLGLSLGHDHRHLLRAVTEGVGLALRLLVEGYDPDLSASPFVVGGATRSRAWMQQLAGILGSSLRVASSPEAACVGAAILAATAVGDVASPTAGAAQMGLRTVRFDADATAAETYRELFSAYRTTAQQLSELYSAPGYAAPAGREAR